MFIFQVLVLVLANDQHQWADEEEWVSLLGQTCLVQTHKF